MKIKITPLFICAIVLAISGIYLLLTIGDGSWGSLAALFVIGVGIISFIVYLIFRLLFKTKVKTQMLIEIILIAVAAILYLFLRVNA